MCKIISMLEYLRDILKEKGLTLKAFSEISGISQPNLSNYINGNISPTLDTVEKIARSLNMDIRELFPRKENIEVYVKIDGKSYNITDQDILKIVRHKNEFESK